MTSGNNMPTARNHRAAKYRKELFIDHFTRIRIFYMITFPILSHLIIGVSLSQDQYIWVTLAYNLIYIKKSPRTAIVYIFSIVTENKK